MIKDSLYHAIEQCNLKEIENISNELVKVDLDNPNAFQQLKNFLLLLSARHLFYYKGFLEAETIIDDLFKIKLNNDQLYKLLSVPPPAGDFEGILKHFRCVDAEDVVVKATVYSAVGNFNKAIEYFQRALRLTPQNSNLYISLGNQFVYLGQEQNARLCFEKSIEVNPNNPYAWFLLSCLGRLKENSNEYCKKAIELKPDFHRAHLELAFNYFYQGKLKPAWKEYEHRFDVYENSHTITRLFDPSKKWNGQSLNDKTIIVYCEQGLGDAMQFVRYVQVLKNRYKVEVILQTAPEYDKLFQSLGNKTFVITQKFEPILPKHDYHVSVLSLPYLLNTLIPAATCFEAKKIDLNSYDNFIKIGICWTGSPDNVIDIKRSCPLKEFKPLYDIPGVKLFSLQKDKSKKYYPRINRSEDFSANPDNMDIVDLGSTFNDFTDTANAIVSMDLIVTVETSVVVLAGSLNVPTWTLISDCGDWRWGLKSKKTPWFKNMRLYRQQQSDNWTEVIKKVKKDLLKEIKLGNIHSTII